jgi:hypothetical protein
MNIQYQNRIVSFIDVLGFSELVYSKSIDPIQNYFNYVLDEFKDDLQTFNFNYFLISDSIVIHSEYNKDLFEHMIRIVTKLQMKLITRGVLTRGAISSGDLFTDNSKNVVVGTGLIKAYNLEKVAVYPRVIIDRELIVSLYENTEKMIAENHGWIRVNPVNSYLMDFPYLNYTYKLAIVMQIPKLNKVAELLQNNFYLNKNIDKYVWLKYHILDSITAQMDFLSNKHSQNKRDKYRIRLLNDFRNKIEPL